MKYVAPVVIIVLTVYLLVSGSYQLKHAKTQSEKQVKTIFTSYGVINLAFGAALIGLMVYSYRRYGSITNMASSVRSCMRN